MKLLEKHQAARDTTPSMKSAEKFKSDMAENDMLNFHEGGQDLNDMKCFSLGSG